MACGLARIGWGRFDDRLYRHAPAADDLLLVDESFVELDGTGVDFTNTLEFGWKIREHIIIPDGVHTAFVSQTPGSSTSPTTPKSRACRNKVQLMMSMFYARKRGRLVSYSGESSLERFDSCLFAFYKANTTSQKLAPGAGVRRWVLW